MLYNKSRDQQIRDKKVLHKVKKRWVIVSSALLMALGGYAATHTAPVHADVNSQSDSASKNIKSNQESVSQLTNQNGKMLSGQGQSNRASQTTSVQSNKVTSQAHQLHTQILQNSIVHNGSVNRHSQTTNHTSQNNNSVSKNVSAWNSNTGSNNGRRLLGESVNTSDVGYISVIYKDVDKSDKTYNQPVGQQDTVQAGKIGQTFTSSDKASFMSEPTKGYTYDPARGSYVINDVNKFEANPQDFIIGVVPSLPSKQKAVNNRIVVEYENDAQGNVIINNPLQWTYSDKAGRPFGMIPYEVEVPQKYSLDLKNTEEISNEQSDGSISSDQIVQPMVDPKITYKPGTQLIQIRVKPAATMYIDYVDSNNHQTVRQYTVTGATGNSFDVIPYEYGRVPNGYTYTGQTQDVPSVYQNDAHMTIDVKKNGTSSDSHNSQPNQQVWVTVDYVAKSGPKQGKTVKQIHDQGLNTGNLNTDKYRSEVPMGFQYDGISNNVQTYAPNETVEISVSPATPQPSSDQPAMMEIDYVSSDGTKITSSVAQGKSNESFNGDVYKQLPYMPNHYHYVKYNSSLPATFVNGEHVSMEVARNMAKMPIIYVDNGSIVGRATAEGPSDSNFNADKFEKSVTKGGYLPYGFNYVDFKNGQPSVYENPSNDEPITIEVSKSQSHSSDNNQPKSQVTMSVEYQNNNTTIKQIPVSGTQGEYFDVSSYENQIPQGYSFAGTPANDPTQYENGGVVIINITPNQIPHPVQMSVHYVSNGQVVGVNTVSGNEGQPFDPTQVENDAMSKTNGKYQYDGGSINVPSTYQPNVPVTIDVDPVANPQTIAHMTVDYVKDGQLVGTEPVVGISGTPIKQSDLVTYEQDALGATRGRYSYDSGLANMINAPTDYTNGQTITIPVIVINGHNNTHKESMGSITFEYINDQTRQVSYSPTLQGIVGTPFNNLDFYEHSVPAGTHFVKSLIDGSNIVYTSNPQTIKIEVSPNKTTQIGTITIHYRNVNNGQVMTNDDYPTSEAVGMPFNVQDFDEAPNGYRIVGVYSGGNVDQYTTLPQNIVLNVTPDVNPVNPNQNQIGLIVIQYFNGKGTPVGQDAMTTHKVGTPFNMMTLIDSHMPKNYYLIRILGGANVSQYTAKPQYVNVEVAPNHTVIPNVKNGKITVIYMDADDNVVGPYDTFTKKVGTPFDALVSISTDMPNGYHFVQIINGSNVNRYTGNEQFINVKVAPNSQPRPQSNNNRPVQPQPSQPTNNYNPSFNPVINNYPNSSSANQPNNSVSNPTSSQNSGSDSHNRSNNPSNHMATVHNRKGHTRNNYQHNNARPVTTNNNVNPDSGTNNKSSYGQMGITNGANQQTAGTSMVQSDDMTDVSDDVTSDASVNANQSVEPSDSNDNSQLPQTGETSHDRDLAAMASILATIGTSLTQLGYSLDKRRRH